MKKGQAANELAMVLGIMILFLVAFLAVLGDRLVVATDDRARGLAEDIAEVIESELVLAANAQDGYSRVFTLPESLDGMPYALVLLNRTNTEANFSEVVLTVNTSSGEYTAIKVLPDNIFGAFSLGSNLVRKRNGLVNLTPPLA